MFVKNLLYGYLITVCVANIVEQISALIGTTLFVA